MRKPSSAVRRHRAALAVSMLTLSGVTIVNSLVLPGPASSATTKTTKTTKKPATAKKALPKPVPTTTKVKSGATSVTTPTIPTTPATNATVKAAAGANKKCLTKVMPLGDSLTAFPDSYRGPLFRQLQALGYQVDFVGSQYWDPTGGGDPNSEGHGGYTIGPDEKIDSEGKPGNIAQNIDGWIKAARPDVILLTIGTNDLSANEAKAKAAPAKLKALVEHITSANPNIKVVVGDIPPNIYNVKAPADTKAVNDVARSLGSASATDNITYADTYNGLMKQGFDPTTGLNDGTHFTIPGGEMFAKAWLPSVQSVLDSRTC